MDERQIARIIASCETEKARATCFYALRIAEAIETVMSKKVSKKSDITVLVKQ